MLSQERTFDDWDKWRLFTASHSQLQPPFVKFILLIFFLYIAM